MNVQPFPPGCPPHIAVPMEGEFFRFAAKGLKVGEVTGESSWLRPYDSSPNYRKKYMLPEAHGLSVFANREDALKARDISPALAKKPLASLEITQNDGVLKHSPSLVGKSHHDWWTSPFDLIPTAIVIDESREELK